MQGNGVWTEREYVNDDEKRRATAHSLGVPFVLLSKDDISPLALVLIPEPLSRAHTVVAYSADDSGIEVALLDVTDAEKVAALYPGKKIKPRLTSQASIKLALMQYQKHLKDVYGNALQAGDIDALILHALLNKASHVHLDVTPSGATLRYRINGALHEAMRINANAGVKVVQNIKTLASLFSEPVIQFGKFKVERDGETVQISVSNIPSVGGERITMRLSSETLGSRGFTLSALGLHGTALEGVHRMLHAKSGLILIAGPKGGGKTTMAHTCIDHLQRGQVAIATIEQNITHHITHATQTEVRKDVGRTQEVGLRAILRSDPDVVLVDAIDTKDTALLALQAANRGVLVFATVESGSASQAIGTLVDMGVPERLLASCLLGVVSVLVVAKRDSGVGQEVTLSREEGSILETRASFGKVLAALKDEGQVHEHTAWKDIPFYRTDASKGVVGVQEVMPLTTVLKEMIMQQVSVEGIEDEARAEGMLTLVEDALFKAVQGLISIDEALQVAGE